MIRSGVETKDTVDILSNITDTIPEAFLSLSLSLSLLHGRLRQVHVTNQEKQHLLAKRENIGQLKILRPRHDSELVCPANRRARKEHRMFVVSFFLVCEHEANTG